MNTNHCIEVCNQLLRGEQSAVASYASAIASMEAKERSNPTLKGILEEHQKAVLTLTENVKSMGGQPSTDSGAWGAFATTVQGAANALGDTATLKSLQTGEAAGRSDYEAALGDNDVMPECKTLIRETLLPAVETHIKKLDAMMA